MVKLTGPIMSLAAGGSVGKVLTVANWKGRPYAKKFSIPTNNQQAAQLGIRAVMGFLSNQWASLSAAEQATWENLAASKDLSPFNAYLGYNLQRSTEDEMPTQEFPPAAGLNPGNFVNMAPEVHATYVVVKFANFPGNPVWATTIYRSASAGFSPGPENRLFMVPAGIFPTGSSVIDRPPSHGTWYYKFRSGNPTGGGLLSPYQATAVY